MSSFSCLCFLGGKSREHCFLLFLYFYFVYICTPIKYVVYVLVRITPSWSELPKIVANICTASYTQVVFQVDISVSTTANSAHKYRINKPRYTKLTLSVNLASKSVVRQQFDRQPRLVSVVMSLTETRRGCLPTS